ncbi:MAG: hypothetical protein DRI75_04310 [Bacteroidetes bacterium]|nr:MAG: hypothetical protein DRI75_04310 [Bacteroidota bacterium]
MNSCLDNIVKQFEYYKILGDKTFEQLNDTQIQWQFNEESNSIAIITKHIVGNMLSRWTNFLTEDGEKTWRHRDTEFEDPYTTKNDMIIAWEKGWNCLFKAMKLLNENDLKQLIYIRNQGHTVTEAINRQLSHYAFHIGQIVYVGKMIKGNDWQSLSVPKGKSAAYNKEKFGKKKDRRHFTDDL